MGMYRMRKCRQILKQSYAWYKKKGGTLSKDKREILEKNLEDLDQALLAKEREKADGLAKKLQSFGNSHFKRSYIEYAIEFLFALAFALIIATIVRQVWFELYEIPTGSMRPTFKEKDRLTVTKTAFGINVPLMTKQFYFDPDLVQRTSVLIFSADNLPMRDREGSYFWIFPAWKRFIKRLIAKPGDSIYFYGGRLYGVDKEGKPLKDLISAPWMEKLEYVPFNEFQGEVTSPNPQEIVFSLFQKPVGRFVVSPFGEVKGEVFNGKEWVKDIPTSQGETYGDFLGIRNYAMARLLTKEQLPEVPGLEEGVLYLELSHNPSLTYPKPLFYQSNTGVIPAFNPFKSYIPLKQEHLNRIMDNLYTARFDVKNGIAKQYSVSSQPFSSSTHPTFQNVPDGTYEFYHGKLNRIQAFGVSSEVPKSNALYSHDPKNIQKLFNLGIDFHTYFQPSEVNRHVFPRRYAYFREGNLYLMGAPVLKKGDPTLEAFLERELKKQNRSTESRPYIAFQDYGAPLKEDGSYDVEFIRTFGVTVPEEHYMMLGDNHAMSGDSRAFGFVPQANIEGAPSLIIWPPGKRWGFPDQKPYPIFNLPRSIIWSIALVILAIWYYIYRKSIRTPVFKKIQFSN